jgi:hypothetical protein
MPGLLTIETRAGQPVQTRGAQVTPFSQAIHLRFPGLPGGLIWNRPVSLLAVYPDGREEVLRVEDPTRRWVWTLLGVAFLAWVITVLMKRYQNERSS